MRIFVNLRLLIGRMIALILPLAALATSLASSPPSWSQTTTPPPCSWPTEVTGRGLSNVGSRRERIAAASIRSDIGVDD